MSRIDQSWTNLWIIKQLNILYDIVTAVCGLAAAEKQQLKLNFDRGGKKSKEMRNPLLIIAYSAHNENIHTLNEKKKWIYEMPSWSKRNITQLGLCNLKLYNSW